MKCLAVDEFVQKQTDSPDSRTTPLFGCDFLPGVDDQHLAIPTWGNLIANISEKVDKHAKLSAEDKSRLKLFERLEDYVSYLSLLEKKGKRFTQILESAFEVDWASKRTFENMEPYQVFLSANWNIIASTNFDGLIEYAIDDELQMSYASTNFEDFDKALASTGNDTMVFRFMGRWRDVFAPALLSWQSLIRELSLPVEFLLSLSDNLVETVDPSDREAYREALCHVLPAATENESSSHSLFLERFDAVIKKAAMLMFGISYREPFWQILLWRGPELEFLHEHFLLTPTVPVSAPDFVNHVTFEYSQFSELSGQLYEAFSNRAHAAEEQEKADRSEGYRKLWSQYQWGESELDWLHQDFKDGVQDGSCLLSLTPFVELWANQHDQETDQVLNFELADSHRFDPGKAVLQAREAYWNYRDELRDKKLKSQPQNNEVKPRVNLISKDPQGRLTLQVEPVEYKDYLATNHFVANVGDPERRQMRAHSEETKCNLISLVDEAYSDDDLKFDARKVLCGTSDAILLRPDAKCSNHLGASSLLIASYRTKDDCDLPVIICPPSGNQISSPSEIIPAISGSVDWPLKEDAVGWQSGAIPLDDIELKKNPNQFFSMKRELLREFFEECLAGRHEIRLDNDRIKFTNEAVEYAEAILKRLSLVNFCQNVQRGGKPELFFIASLRFSANHFLRHVFSPNWELKQTWWDLNYEEIISLKYRARSRRTELYPSPIDSDFRLAPEWEKAADLVLEVICHDRFNPVLKANLAALLRYCHINHPKEFAPWVEQSGLSFTDP